MSSTKIFRKTQKALDGEARLPDRTYEVENDFTDCHTNLVRLVGEIWNILNIRARRTFVGIIFFSLIVAFLEAISMGLVVPFVGLVSNPTAIAGSYWYGQIVNRFHFVADHVLVATGAALLLFFIIKNVLGFLLFRLQCNFVFREKQHVSLRLLSTLMNRPYALSLQKSPQESIRLVNHEVDQAFVNLILPLTLVVGEVFTILSILILLIMIEPMTTLIVGTLSILGSFSFHRFMSRSMQRLGAETQTYGFNMQKILAQALEGYKELKIFGREDFFLRRFRLNLLECLSNWRRMRIMGECPRFIIETVAIGGLLLVACLVYLQPNNRPFLLPILSLFAAAAFRILPSLSRIMGSLASIAFGRPSLTLLQGELRQPDETTSNISETVKSLDFSSMLTVRNLSFGYEIHRQIIQNLSFDLPKGQSLAIVGRSGTGKSTLLDLLLGLLTPTNGEILVDGKTIMGVEKPWRKNVGYVPQHIFLLDGNIRENVAYGVDISIQNDHAIWQALERAALADFVKTLPQQLETQIGERGVRLSGGQRQRLGIARALFPEPKILVLDEATANLDVATEHEIMQDVFKMALTLVIVSHKPELVERAQIKVNL